MMVIKPLHARWLIKMYNFFTTTEGRSIVIKGWKKAGIIDVLDGTTTVTEEDPFKEIFRDYLNDNLRFNANGIHRETVELCKLCLFCT